MRSFFHVSDIGDLNAALAEAREVKRTPYQWHHLGEHRTIMLVFFNSSLRTRLSSQKAALNLGMSPIVLNIGQDSWKLETELGVVMDGDKSEHLREAIPVMASYCDIIGVRSFAGLTDREFDYSETILRQFVEYAGKPVISLESATVHPCQAFADLITIDEYWRADQAQGLNIGRRPKVVLTWAPHPRALPQAVPNSFAEWMNAADVDLVITHPEGYELDPLFVGKAQVEYDQMKALQDADFVYAKNWSCPGVTCPQDYGKILSKDTSWTIDDWHMAVTNNARFMHCLPVRRNMIVSDSVIDSPRSIVIPEAANRVVSAQVVMKRMLESL
ncbi:MAG: N-acetylornithine carbamoyltransferase [Paludibacteraceae bacterium]|nr:N-acetylornithine carbamoyltransferase [Paludibacteraceae bacterium]